MADDAVRLALDEDRADHDITVALLGPAAGTPATGRFIAEAPCVVAGLDVAASVFRALDPATTVAIHVEDGQQIAAGTALAEVRGAAGSLLSAERTALNFLQHLCGVATLTRRAVDAVAGTGAAITHTRKTLPGLRALQVRAVLAGGGVANRVSLEQAVYWKDNHWALLGRTGRSLADVLAPAGDREVWVEVDTDAQFAEALAAGVTRILADNQTPERVAEWVQRAGARVVIQASGGITVASAPAYARAGARLISMGGLTHSVAGVPITFEVLTGS